MTHHELQALGYFKFGPQLCSFSPKEPKWPFGQAWEQHVSHSRIQCLRFLGRASFISFIRLFRSSLICLLICLFAWPTHHDDPFHDISVERMLLQTWLVALVISTTQDDGSAKTNYMLTPDIVKIWKKSWLTKFFLFTGLALHVRFSATF